MTWAEYKEIINHTPYNNDLEYKVHYAWIHGEKTFRADRLLFPETTIVIIPAYVSKGLEFDSVIIYNDRNNSYKSNERNLLYVACTRCQHELYIYN